MTSDASFFRLRAKLVEAVERRLAAAEGTGLTPADLGDPAELAARVSTAIPIRQPTAELVGACYDTTSLVRWLGLSKQAIARRRETRTVLACRASNGRWLYPAWQFDANGRTSPHLPELISILDGGGTRQWRAARWLAAPSPALRGQVSAAQWLLTGGDPAPVLAAARADSARWAD